MKEADIRSKELFDEFLELSVRDGQEMLKQRDVFVEMLCPACSCKDSEQFCLKNNFGILQCCNCQSLFCSPRPNEKQVSDFYRSSQSARFLSDQFYPKLLSARKEKLFAPKAEAIKCLLEGKNFIPQNICDVGAGYGLLLEALGEFWPKSECIAVEPSHGLAELCRQKGITTLEKPIEELDDCNDKFDLVTCFEVIEHVFDPMSFVKEINKIVKPGGHCLVTGPCCDGFDILVLGEKSKSVFPPHHLNVLSVKGFKHLFETANFCEIEITTPGKLDVDIVHNYFADKETAGSGFTQMICEKSEKTREYFQEFLANNKLSSHAWIFAKKR